MRQMQNTNLRQNDKNNEFAQFWKLTIVARWFLLISGPRVRVPEGEPIKALTGCRFATARAEGKPYIKQNGRAYYNEEKAQKGGPTTWYRNFCLHRPTSVLRTWWWWFIWTGVPVLIGRFYLSESKCTVSARILHGFKTCKGCKSLQNRYSVLWNRINEPGCSGYKPLHPGFYSTMDLI